MTDRPAPTSDHINLASTCGTDTVPPSAMTPAGTRPLTRIDDVALVFEGGGMRGTYTAGFVTTLLDEGLDFPDVSGISAGSSHTVNYVARQRDRARDSFVDMVTDPAYGGWRSLRAGTGYFNADHIYHEAGLPDGTFPFDFDAFRANPAEVHIASFNASRGRQEWFTKADMPRIDDMMRIVRASSTLPILMPEVVMNGDVYVDGALGQDGGIALDAAHESGYRRFVVVLTRPRDYVKGALRPVVRSLLRHRYPDLPSIVEGVARRPGRYNAARQAVFRLEEQGRAFVFAPERMPVSSTRTRHSALAGAYELGRAQAERELPALRAFLGL